jgi:hypothetical protein
VHLAALSMGPLLFVQEFRDIVVIVWGILSILLLLTLTIVVITLALSVKRLITDVNDLLNSGVKPVLASARDSAENVAGTTRFVGDRVVAPVIRVISIVAAVRRGVAIFTGLTGRGKHE